MAQRAQTFQALKPVCVALSDAALKRRSSKSNGNDVLGALHALEKTINNVPKNVLDLDAKLAEYVFFPLSHIFRDKNALPLRALEVASTILKTLLETGWRRDIAPELGMQLLILLTFLAGGSFGEAHSEKTSAELQTLSFECQALVCKSLGSSEASKMSVISTKNVPAIGHAVTVMLSGLKEGESNTVQLAAIGALQAFHDNLATRNVSASFLPGLVSCLSHVLTPSTKVRRSYWVLVQSINLLGEALTLVVSDEAVESSPVSKTNVTQKNEALIPELDASWLKATGAQVKLALANVIKLRQHARVEVRKALNELCFRLLEICRHSLSDCVNMLLQTIITLEPSLNQEMSDNRLKVLVSVDESLPDSVRASLYDWLVSLPRIMQSNDDDAKTRVATQIASSVRLLRDTDVEMSVVDHILVDSLRDSIANALNHQVTAQEVEATPDPSNSSLSLITTNATVLTATLKFPSILSDQQQTSNDITSLERVIQEVSRLPNSLAIAQDSLDTARIDTNINDRIASFYIAFTVLKSRITQEAVISSFVDLQSASDPIHDFQEELYAFALSFLTNASEVSVDWRLQALSLEVIAFYASHQGMDFRTSLVDTLYPIVHLLGSSNAPLRQHAVTTLDSLSASCGYESAKDLLVSNADYLVNSIGLKLGSFDIEPQAPQVLNMMVRLSGPKLIPYLDDVVDGVFEALEAFHGYGKLTELLFYALNAIVEVGVTAPALTIDSGSEIASHEKRAAEPTTVDGVVDWLTSNRSKRKEREETSTVLPERTPQKPWGKLKSSQAKSLIEEVDESANDQDDSADEESETPHKDPSAPLTPTYQLLQRITTLTQHHLPSSSPSLRTSLLNLLRTSLPYLAAHEDTFLPLIHTLWPVLLPRLSDSEAYVVAATLEVLATMCAGAGDFMSSRVNSLWPTIRKIYARIETGVKSHRGVRTGPTAIASAASPASHGGAGSLRIMDRSELTLRGKSTNVLSPSGSFNSTPTQISKTRTSYVSTTATLLKTSLTSFLLALLSHVRVSEKIFSEICTEMLREALVDEGEQADKVRAVLQRRNPDVVWLVKQMDKAGYGKREKEWRRPKDIPGAPRFREVCF